MIHEETFHVSSTRKNNRSVSFSCGSFNSLHCDTQDQLETIL